MDIKVNETQALIDKVTFSNVRIAKIQEMEKLIDDEIIQKKPDDPKAENEKPRYYTNDGKCFDSLRIVNDEFMNSLRVGIDGRTKKLYGTMQISVKNDTGNNLKCNNIDDYKTQLEQTKNHILERYGVLLDFSQITIKKIEINRTFKLENDFGSYKRVFKFIMGLFPKSSYLNIQGEYRRKNGSDYEYQTLYAMSSRNKRQEFDKKGNIKKPKQYLVLKIYNKTKQLMGFIVLDDDYMRLEFTIVGAQKVKRELKTNKFYELTDEEINNWFDKKIQNWIAKPIEKYQIDQNKKILKLMKEQLQSKNHWISNTLAILSDEEIKRDFPVILDVEEVLPIIDSLKVERPLRVKDSFRKQAQKINTVLSNRDDLKFAEILEKLTRKADANTCHQMPPELPPQTDSGREKMADRKTA